jgi:hypothetical protein
VLILLLVLLLGEFLSGDFMKASYFESTKDRVIRGLRTYFESRRADSHAVYYRDALLASKDEGIDVALAMAEVAELQSVKDHHECILGNTEVTVDCLFSGNVSAENAKAFFSKATKQLQEAQKKSTIPATVSPINNFIPGKRQTSTA